MIPNLLWIGKLGNTSEKPNSRELELACSEFSFENESSATVLQDCFQVFRSTSSESTPEPPPEIQQELLKWNHRYVVN